MVSRKILKKLIALTNIWLFVLISYPPCQTGFFWENQPKKKILDNGLTLVYHEDKSSALTVLQIIIKGGQRAESEGKGGLSYLTTRLVIEIPDLGKVQDLMSQASRVYMVSKGDYSLINITSLSEHLEETLKIVSKIILSPLFSGLRIDSIKKQMLYHKGASEDQPLMVGHNTYLEKLFGGTAYGISIFGSKESLKNIKKKDIKNYHENYFKAENMLVAVSSDLEEEKITETILKYFKKLPRGQSTEPKPKPPTIPEEKTFFIEKDTKQSFVSIGFPLPKISPKNFVLAYMLENLLGKGVGSKLWSLRSREKLAYNVNCQALQMKEGGILETYLETDTEKKDIALNALKKVLDDLYESGITEEEFEITKINSKSSFLRGNETKENRVSNLGSFEALGFGHEFLRTFFEEVETTQLEEINAFIKDILNPENGVEVVVGPKKIS